MSMEPLPAIGARVAVVINRQSVHGIVRYVGEAEFKEGIWVGLELDKPIGKNDGSIQGVRYFTCADKHGIFALPKMLEKIEGDAPCSPGKSPGSRRSDRPDSSPPSRGDPTSPKTKSNLRANSENSQRQKKPSSQNLRPSNSTSGSSSKSPRGSPRGSLGRTSKPRAKSGHDTVEKQNSLGYSRQDSLPNEDFSDDPIRSQSSQSLGRRLSNRSLRELKAQLADAVEEHDVDRLRDLLVCAAMQDSPELVAEIQQASSVLQHEVQQQMLKEQHDVQQQLLANQIELTRLLKEAGTNHVQAKPDKAQKNELERLKQQVAKIKTFDNQVGEMQKAAADRAKNLNRQLADLRSDSLGILQALEAKLQGDGSASAAMSKVAARGQALQAPALKERGSADKDRKAEPEAEAEEVAYEQTLNPRYVLMGAEDDVADAALRLAQNEWEKYVAQSMLEATNFSTKDLSQASAIMSFIPNTLKRCIRHKLVAFHQWKVLLESPLRSQYSPILSRFDAAVVFADASGFTRLTETLAQEANGAERIGETLNKFFAPVINLVHKHGGDVIKFSGDALTIIWASSEPAATMAQRSDASGSRADKELAMAAACSFCLEVQEQIPIFGSTGVKGCSLTLHIGVGFGNLALLQLGGLLGRWEYCVAGAALDQIAIAEPLASPGETVLSAEAVSLATSFEFEDLPSTANAPPGFKKLLSNKSSDTASTTKDRLAWWQTDEGTDLEMKLVRRYVPSAVGQAFVSASAEDEQATLEEMRRVSVIFVSISGLDPCKDEPRVSRRGTSAENTAGFTGAKETQLIMRLLQLSVYALEGSVNKFLVDDKGVLLLVVFGLPPLIHFADDPTRAVLCAMRVSDTLRDEGLEGHIGVATGMCWCGVVGAPQRREYTVLGDVVNLSARLMGKAPVNGVIVDAATKEIASRTLQFEDGGELRLKGKSKAVRVFHFTGIKQGVASQKNVLRTPLLSWPAWQTRASLVSALQMLQSQSGVLYINGHTGSGKAELTEELRSWANLNSWTLLEGQNLDPSGTFTMPMLSLQQVFRKLGVAVKRDPFWRHQGQELTSISLGDYVQDYRTSGHTGLYWIMIAMIRLAVGKQYCELLEPWAPLLNLVVTQLAFSPRVIAAMQERNEQHIRHERFSELCTAVLDGFSRFGSNERGTIVLIQLRRSTGLLQRHDKLEEAVIHAIANLCMRRRLEATPQARPLVLAIITPSESFKDGQDAELKVHAMKCGSYVEAGDLDAAQTKDYVEHYMSFDIPATSLKRGASRTPDDASSSPQKLRQTLNLGRARMGVPRSTVGDSSPVRQDSSKSVNFGMGDDVQARTSWGSGEMPQSGNKEEDLGAGDHVVVIKESRLKGRTAVVLEPDWNGMVKVNMDEDDEKGRIKSFKRADIEIAGSLNRKDMIPEFVFEVTGGNLGIIHALLEDLEEQGALVFEQGKRVPAAEVKSLRWLREKIALPEFMVGLAFSTFEQLLPAQKQVLKAASSMEADFSLIELGAALPDMDADTLADICEELSLPSARTFRKVGTTRNSKIFDRENVRYQFYSRVLRQASGTLVLESQRSIIRQRTVRSRTMNGKRLSRLMSGVDMCATDSEHDSS